MHLPSPVPLVDTVEHSLQGGLGWVLHGTAPLGRVFLCRMMHIAPHTAHASLPGLSRLLGWSQGMTARPHLCRHSFYLLRGWGTMALG